MVNHNKCVLILPVKENRMVYISHSYQSISTIINPKTKLSCHVLVHIYTITMVCLISEHHSHLKCTLLHWRLLFVSMSRALSFWRLFDKLYYTIIKVGKSSCKSKDISLTWSKLQIPLSTLSELLFTSSTTECIESFVPPRRSPKKSFHDELLHVIEVHL